MCGTQMEDISVIDVQRINPSHFEMVFSNSDRNKLHSYSRSMCNQSEKLSTINIQVAVNAVWTLRSIAQVWSYINNNQTGWAFKKNTHTRCLFYTKVFSWRIELIWTCSCVQWCATVHQCSITTYSPLRVALVLETWYQLSRWRWSAPWKNLHIAWYV